MMPFEDSQETLLGLQQQGHEAVEVFHKLGHSRSYRTTCRSFSATIHHEEGHAIRAGSRRSAFFAAATGPPRLGNEWPRPHDQGVELPPPTPIPDWQEPDDLDQRLFGEGEAKALIESLRAAVESEFGAAVATDYWLADGTSESLVLNSRGLTAHSRQRTASVLVEARTSSRQVVSMQAFRSLRHVDAMRLARHLADRLTIAERAQPVAEERGHCLLAPAVTAALLSALRPLWIGPEARARALELNDGRGRFAHAGFTLIDDPRLANALLSNPFDGEGSPTRRIVLVDRGRFKQPLLTWNQRREPAERWSGCNHRAGWRDLPSATVSQLFIAPNASVSTADLLAELGRGFYAVSPEGPARISPDFQRFSLPISGYLISNGAAAGCFDAAALSGRLSSFLHGIRGTARDLEFFPHGDSLFGSPSLWVRGLRLTAPTP